jgi:hypothetical protein
MNKKQFGIWAITLLVTGLMVSVSAVAIVQQTEEKEVMRTINLNRSEVSITAKATEYNMPAKKISENQGVLSPIPLFEGMHPAVASGGSSVLLGFDDLDLMGTYFSSSPDGGITWTDAGGWDLGQSEFASVDYWAGSKFFGTCTPDYTTSGQVTLMQFEDVNNFESWVASSWDWEDYDIYDLEGHSMSCGDDSFEAWRFGFITMAGFNGYSTPTADGCPYVFIPIDDGYATISWLTSGETGNTLDGCYNAASAMDKDEQLHYAIWERESETGYKNIEVRCDRFDFNVDSRNYFQWAAELVTEENNENPDICANNNNVILVSEIDGNIVAYYSFDGLDTFEASIVATGASNPRITSVGDNEAVCTFVQGGTLKFVTTSDGGETWGTPESASEGSVVNDYHESDVCEAGAVYTGNDDIIYFNSVGIARAIVTIASISGGTGVSAVIENIGDADATDVEWSMTATGGILGMINSEASGTISIAAGGTQTISLPMLFGLGAVTIEVRAGSASETVEGTQLLILTRL